MTATPTTREGRFLAGAIKDGGVAGIPTSYYRKALDLNRFSNGVANKLLESYRRQIVKAVRELERIDKMPSSKKPQFKAARMRALIQQNLDSMRSWSTGSVDELIKQLDGLADVEVAFATGELQRAVPADIKTSVRTVEVTESFAKSVVSADPLSVGTNLLQQNIEEAVKGPGALLKLTARQGAIIRMPDGTSVEKAFRGLAERQGELFSRAVLDGLLTGESTASIARSLYGELGFSTEALTPRQVALAQTGNAWKMAKHQVRTLVRTSVNATSNAASQQVYRANPEITKKYRWVATLDNRTSPICRNLDQSVYEYGKGPTPANPPHFNCRSTTIPIIDYEGLGFDPPPDTFGYRPTTESRPNSRDPDGGRVPVNVSAAQHIYDLRGTTKSGRKSKFEPSAAQARMLNGGRDTAAGRQKARYFNRLADRYGPDGAMKRFMRTDGTEVSLAQLRSRYGQPEKITQTKKPAPPKPKTSTATAKPASSTAANTVLRPGPKNEEVFAAQGGTAKMYADSFDQLEALGGEVGANARKMRRFMEKQNIMVHAGATERFSNAERFAGNQALIQSQRKAVEILEKQGNNRGALVGAKQLLQALETGDFGQLKHVMGKLSGCAGYTSRSSGIVNTYMTPISTALDKKRVERVVASAEDSLKQMNAYIAHYKDYKPGVKPPKQPWTTDGLGGGGKFDDDQWFATTIHEVGHQVHYRGTAATKLGNKYRGLGGEKFVSEYAHSNEYEQFAEAFVQYVLNPKGLKQSHPRLHKWVEDGLEEALK